MMKLKKIGAILLAIMMIAMMGLAFAADDDGDTAGDGIAGNTSGVWSNQDTPVAQTDKTAILYKEIKAYNPEESTVNAPTITYTYTLTPGSANKEIYDDAANHDSGANARVLTKEGITKGVEINDGTPGSATSAVGTVTWNPATADDQLDATADGESNKKTISIDFSGVTFTGAGVYRYEINETAATYESSGVVEGTTGHTRYLDVYVKDGSTAGEYEIYGFVCFVNNNNIDAQDDATSNTVSDAIKTEGFVERPDPTDPDAEPLTADQYYTYNVLIKKVLAGDQAMNSHEFPFLVTFQNTTVTDAVLPIVTKEADTATIPSGFAAGNINSLQFDGTTPSSDADRAKKLLKIANGGEVLITGIPAGTKVFIDEYNDVTGTTYTTTTDGATEDEEDGISLSWNTWTYSMDAWGDTTATGEGTVYTLSKTYAVNEAAENNFEVTVTNTLLLISPTGVVMRFAPYLLIMVGGIALLIIAKKHKKHTDEE